MMYPVMTLRPEKEGELLFSGTLTAGAGDVVRTAKVDKVYGSVSIILTNGGTGPTVPAQVQISTRVRGQTSWTRWGGPVKNGTLASEERHATVELPDEATEVQVEAGSNTDQDVAAEIRLGVSR